MKIISKMESDLTDSHSDFIYLFKLRIFIQHKKASVIIN